jgi:2-oxoglutarate dehydrogenase E2 component (dihydrolipoamide succinyltransferase)
MNSTEVKMPPMGEGIVECTVLNWLKKEGERIEADESLLEVATDKVDTEVPSPVGGVLTKLLVKEGDVIQIGSTVALVSLSGDASDPTRHEPTHEIPEVAASLEQEVLAVVESLRSPLASLSSKGGEGKNSGFFSPLVLNIAQQEGVSQLELSTLSGSGLDGRVTKEDILAYLNERKKKAATAEERVPSPSTFNSKESVEIVEMDRMRKIIAERMVESKRISAHVTSFIETDMTAIVRWREKVKDSFKQETGEAITYTPLLVDALVKAIKAYPDINCSVEGSTILYRKDINIGMAVALPSGNLIVPVIHQADQYNLMGLVRKVNDLARRAREGKLRPEEVTGGTYSFSNIGSFGNLMGTPIIVQPQVAIMAFGAIIKKPSVIETPEGDLIGIRNKMFISHSYDHRIVDGALGGMFLKKVSDTLEAFDPKSLTL